MFQMESVRDAAFGCDWVGTNIPFQRYLMFIIATADKEFQLTVGMFVPVSNVTMMKVSLYVIIWVDLRKCVKNNTILYNCANEKTDLPHKIKIIADISHWQHVM